MKLILEGPDNAGKTTLANRIIDQVGDFSMYKHPGGKPADQNAEMACIDEQFGWLGMRRVLIDRVTPISQRVYNPDPDVDPVREQAWWQMRTVFKPIVIYCRPSTDKLLRTQDLTWREGESEEHKQKIIQNQHLFVERYDAIFEKIACVHYTYEDPDSAKLILDKCIEGMKGQKLAESWLSDHMHRWGM